MVESERQGWKASSSPNNVQRKRSKRSPTPWHPHEQSHQNCVCANVYMYCTVLYCTVGFQPLDTTLSRAGSTGEITHRLFFQTCIVPTIFLLSVQTSRVPSCSSFSKALHPQNNERWQIASKLWRPCRPKKRIWEVLDHVHVTEQAPRRNSF